jgi:hypothetical protein
MVLLIIITVCCMSPPSALAHPPQGAGTLVSWL